MFLFYIEFIWHWHNIATVNAYNGFEWSHLWFNDNVVTIYSSVPNAQLLFRIDDWEGGYPSKLSSLVIDGWASISTTTGNSHLRKLPHKLFLHTTSNRIKHIVFSYSGWVGWTSPSATEPNPFCIGKLPCSFFLMNSQWITSPNKKKIAGRETLRGAVAA